MRYRPALGAAVLATGHVTLAAAGDTSDLEGLLEESVVSTASKQAEAASTAPATSMSISADEIRQYAIRSIDEAIRFLAMGLQIENNANTAELGVRGVLLSGDAGAHVLLLIDGHAVNEAWGATAYFDRGTGVPMELIDHIELILGPGSVLYGSNAMLGVVSITTKRAKDFSGAHLVVESEVPISLRAALAYGREWGLFGQDAEVVAAVEHFEQWGPTFDFPIYDVEPDAVTGMPRRYGVEQPLGVWGGAGDDGMWTSASSGYARLRSGGLQVGLRGVRYERGDPGTSGNFDDPDSFIRDRWLSADVKYSGTLNESLTASVRLYGDHYDYQQDWGSYGASDCLEGQESGCMWRLSGGSNWAGVEPQVQVDWLADASLVTLLGVDARIKQIDFEVNYFDYVDGSSPGPVGASDRTEQSLGAYLQNTYWPAKFLGLNVGARFDADSRFGNALSPRAAATLVPWNGAALRLMYAEAFRAPTAWDVYYADPRSWVAGGDGLEPERVHSLELSVEQRFGSQRVSIGVFQSWWHDLVVLQDLSDEEIAAAVASGALLPDTSFGYQLRNVSNIDSYGLNAAYFGAFASGALRYGLSVTHAHTRTSEPGAPSGLLSVAAPTVGNARLALTLPGAWPTVAIAASYVSRRPTTDYTAELPSFVDPAWQWRTALSGTLPIDGLSYRVSASYSTRDVSPHATGAPPADGSARPLVPLDRFRIGIGFQYDLFR